MKTCVGSWSLVARAACGGVACLLAVSASAVTIDMVTVGNAGNGSDTRLGVNTFGFGSVAYDYQIGTYDVTIGQYTAFLNAADPNGTNPNGIYNSAGMASGLAIAGISYTSASSAGSKYAVIGPSGTAYGQSGANRPIAFVSWFDAARFSNWMTNGQGNGSTETGAYNLATAEPGVAPAKTPGAAFYIPNLNEWYKAAYYSPNYGGVGIPGYYAYATQSDFPPGNVVGSAVSQANYAPDGVFSVTQSGVYSDSQNYLTDGGAFSGSGSFYGTFDQSGNVNQWNDLDGAPSSSRGIRGGAWYGSAFFLSSSYSSSSTPLQGGLNGVGFRLASPVSGPGVPEIDPRGLSAVLGLIVGGLGLLERRPSGR